MNTWRFFLPREAYASHPITFTDGKKIKIYNGRLLRSIKRYREKLKARFQRMLSRCERYSNRWWRLVKSENKQLQKLNNKIKDGRHKITRHFANGCKKDEVGIVGCWYQKKNQLWQ